MRDQRIVIYEPARKADPESTSFVGILWLAMIVLLLASWGLSWTWREAEAVIHHPFDAPLYSVLVLAIFAIVHAVLAWGVWRVLRGLFRIVCALAFAIADLLYVIRFRLKRIWR